MQEALCPLTSRLLSSAGFRHAFFTRVGGVSLGEYASLNFSTSVGDDPKCVVENTARAATWLNLPGGASLYCVNQVHGADVVEITEDTVPHTTLTAPADALVSSRAQIACCVRTADCVPLLVADPVSGRVAAVHAGWRGVAAGVVLKTIQTLDELGSRAGQLLVAIGPHIRVAGFEVSEDVAEALAGVAPTRVIVRRDLGPRPHVDLSACVQEQLQRSGVRATNIEDLGRCTFSDPQSFFSYRRQGSASGRHLHAIVARSNR